VQSHEIEGLSERFYVRTIDMPVFDLKSSAKSESIRFIAPLDNILWERSMLSKIFDFDYTWEVYVPEAKRKYGYYVIPVLCGNRFIARFEPEKSKTHIKIKNWWWEKDITVSIDLVELIIKEFERLAVCFNKDDGVHKGVRKVIKASKS